MAHFRAFANERFVPALDPGEHDRVRARPVETPCGQLATDSPAAVIGMHHQVAQPRAGIDLVLDLDLAEVDRARPDDAAVLALGYHPFRLRPQDARRLQRIVEVVRRDPHRAGVRGGGGELGQRLAVAVPRGAEGEIGHLGGSDRA